MTFLHRLRLRQNWPFWGACFLAAHSTGFLLIYLFNPLRYPFDNGVLYPFQVIYHSTVFWFECLNIVCLFITIAWACYTAGGNGWVWIVPTTLILSAIVCAMNPVLGTTGIVGALVLLVSFSFRQKPRSGMTVSFVVVATLFALLPAVNLLFSGFEHRNSLSFNGHIYNLAVIGDNDFDCGRDYFVVYECDSLGFSCYPIYRSKPYGQCPTNIEQLLPEPATLKVDSGPVDLYLQLGDVQFVVASNQNK